MRVRLGGGGVISLCVRGGRQRPKTKKDETKFERSQSVVLDNSNEYYRFFGYIHID